LHGPAGCALDDFLEIQLQYDFTLDYLSLKNPAPTAALAPISLYVPELFLIRTGQFKLPMFNILLFFAALAAAFHFLGWPIHSSPLISQLKVGKIAN
jgi:hypothetical protein